MKTFENRLPRPREVFENTERFHFSRLITFVIYRTAFYRFSLHSGGMFPLTTLTRLYLVLVLGIVLNDLKMVLAQKYFQRRNKHKNVNI